MPELTSSAIASLVGGELRGDADLPIRGVAPLESARPDQLSFVANARYEAYLQDTRAGVVLVTPELLPAVPERLACVVVADPHQALYALLPRLYEPPVPASGVDPTARIDPTASLGGGVSVGAYAVIGADVQIGDGSRVGAHVVVGPRSRIGAECVLHPHVTLYHEVTLGDRCIVHSGARLGREGFGYVWAEGGHRKIPQVGGCVLESDVEVGANVTIDRGSIGDTVVGAGTKIDSLVHLGHNVRVGRHVILVAQVGVSGSTRIGDAAVLGGQAGVGGHLSIGAQARVGAQAGVTADVAAGETVSGYPARPHREALRVQAMTFRLPKLLQRLRALERAVFGAAASDQG